jgi:hypothetical protein
VAEAVLLAHGVGPAGRSPQAAPEPEAPQSTTLPTFQRTPYLLRCGVSLQTHVIKAEYFLRWLLALTRETPCMELLGTSAHDIATWNGIVKQSKDGTMDVINTPFDNFPSRDYVRR